MTAPRFYEIRLLDLQGRARCLSIDLADAQPSERPEIVRATTKLTRELPRESSVRTEYAVVPTTDSALHRVADYLWADRALNDARLKRHLAALYQGFAPHRFVVRNGGWAEGADFVGRRDAVMRARDLLTEGKSLHLMAPRRYGKTSLLRALAIELSVLKDRPVVCLDVESCHDISNLAVQIVDKAFQVNDVLRTAISELRTWPPVEASELALLEARKELLNRIRQEPTEFLGRVARALGEQRVILLIDEFSRFVLKMTANEPEALRGALGSLCDASGLGIVVCGSQGLRNLIEWHQLDALKPLVGLSLDPLERDVAAELVEELFYGHDCAPLPEIIDAVIEEIGAPIPYFLHGLVHHVLAERGGQALALSTVRRAYRKRLLDSDGNEFFRAYRLSERGYPDALRRPAAQVLALLAQREAPTPIAELHGCCRGLSDVQVETLLASLGEDYDIVLGADGARFRSKVMRERWALREAWLSDREESR